MLEPRREVDAVGPQVDVALGREIASQPTLILFRPCRLQPGNSGGRKAWCVRPQQGRQRFAEVTGRDALEIQLRQQLFDRLGAQQIGRKDRRREADTTSASVPLAVADPWPAHYNRADPSLHFAFGLVTIATREVCLDGKRNDQMAFHALADYQNHVIGWLQWEQSPVGDGAVVRFPRIWMSSGECRYRRFRCTRIAQPWAISLSLLQFVGQASLVDDAMLPS